MSPKRILPIAIAAVALLGVSFIAHAIRNQPNATATPLTRDELEILIHALKDPDRMDRITAIYHISQFGPDGSNAIAPLHAVFVDAMQCRYNEDELIIKAVGVALRQLTGTDTLFEDWLKETNRRSLQ